MPASARGLGRHRVPFVLVAALSLLAALAGPAGAATTWSQISSPIDSGLSVPSIGILGATAVVAWQQDTSPSTEALVSDTFQPTAGATVVKGVAAKIADDWSTVDTRQALIPTAAGGLQISFGGIHSTAGGDPLIGLINEQFNGDGTWSAPTVIGSGQGASNAATGVLGPAGPVYANASSGAVSILVNPTSEASRPVADLQTPLPAGSDGYDVSLALDSSGHLWAAWYSSSTGNGVYVQQLDPATGLPVAAALRAPGSDDIDNNNSDPVALSCVATCRVVYGTEPSGSSTDAILSWWPGEAAPTTIVSLAGTGYGAGRVAATHYRSDGKLWVAWFNGKTYSYTLGDAAGAGGVIQDAGIPAPFAGGAGTLAIAPIGNDLLLATDYGYNPGATNGIFVDTVAPPAPLVTLPVPRQQTLQAGPGKTFRIQVQFRVPAVCKPSCSARAELRTRTGRQQYAVAPTAPLPGDGKIVLGTRASVKLPGGKKVRFYLTISKAELLKSPFTTVGGNRVANTRLRVWLTTPKGPELAVADGRIAVSIARIKSGALPGLSGIL